MRGIRIFVQFGVFFMAVCFIFPGYARATLVKIDLAAANARARDQVIDPVRPGLPAWVLKVGGLYMQQDSAGSVEDMLAVLENRLGINPDGRLDLIQAWECMSELSGYVDQALEYSGGDKTWLYFLKDKFSLVGFNYLYFEICTKYRDEHKDRFIRYFENGFYPNRHLFSQNAHYYKSLYYYLYLITPELSQQLSSATAFLNDFPDREPQVMLEDNKRRFKIAVACAADLDLFMPSKTDVVGNLYEKIFTDQERKWLSETIDYYLSMETHSALLSYEWFRMNMPLDISARVVTHDILKTWEEQAVIYRSRLPLMFFSEKGNTQFSIEEIFEATLEKLRLDNRQLDIMVMSVLESWLTKQVNRGIRVEDRVKYNHILAELHVCPTGWIFANLYDCRTHLAELKQMAEEWSTVKDKKSVFNTRVMEHFFAAKEKIDRIFSDLEKVYGKEHKIGSVDYIFYKYRGEINYYFRYLQFETFKGEGGVIPAAGPEDNYLEDFTIAFMEYPQSSQNHINLLNGYNLLARKLFAAGRIDAIIQLDNEIETLVSGKYKLGDILSHKENNLFDIYQIQTYAYLANTVHETRALETAARGFSLARKYYAQAAEKSGFTVMGKIGAITRDNTEMDDYQRQFELYKMVAGKLGKRIQLLVSEDDIRLYNRIQKMRWSEKNRQ